MHQAPEAESRARRMDLLGVKIGGRGFIYGFWESDREPFGTDFPEAFLLPRRRIAGPRGQDYCFFNNRVHESVSAICWNTEANRLL